MEKLESKLAILGERTTVDELMKQTMSLSTELKQKCQLIQKMELTHESEKNEFKTITKKVTDQLMALKEQLEKAENEKSLMEASLVSKPDFVEVGIMTDPTDENQAIEDALDMNIMLDKQRQELEERVKELETQLSVTSKPATAELTKTQCDLCEFTNDEKTILEDEISSLLRVNNELKSSMEAMANSTRANDEEKILQLHNQVDQLQKELHLANKHLETSGALDIENMTEMLVKAQKSEGMMKLKLEMAEEAKIEAENALQPSKTTITDLTEKVAKLDSKLKESNERDSKTIEDLQYELSIVQNGTSKIEHSIHVPSIKTCDFQSQTELVCLEVEVETDLSALEIDQAARDLDAIQLKFDETVQKHQEDMELKDAQIIKLQEEKQTFSVNLRHSQDALVTAEIASTETKTSHEKHIAEITTQMESLESEKSSLINDLTKAKEEIEQMGIDRAELQKHQLENNEAKSTLERSTEELKIKVETLESEKLDIHKALTKAKEEIVQLEQVQLQRSETKSSLENIAEELKARISTLESEKSSINDELTEANERVNLVEQGNLSHNEIKSSLEKEIGDLKSSVSSLQTEKSELVNELAETNDRLEQLVLEIDTLTDSHKAVQSELDQVNSKLSEADSQVQNMKDLSDERVTRLAENLTKLEKENASLMAQIQNLEGEAKSTDIETKSDKMSKSEMEALGIEDDTDTIESQSQIDIIDSVDLKNCQKLVMIDATTQCITEQNEAACNTSIQGIILTFSLQINNLS